MPTDESILACVFSPDLAFAFMANFLITADDQPLATNFSQIEKSRFHLLDLPENDNTI